MLQSLLSCPLWMFIPYSIFLKCYLEFLYQKEFICSSTLPLALFVPWTVNSFFLFIYFLAYDYPLPHHILTSISLSNSYVIIFRAFQLVLLLHPSILFSLLLIRVVVFQYFEMRWPPILSHHHPSFNHEYHTISKYSW